MSLTEFLRIRDEAFESDDLDWVKAALPEGSRPEVVEMAFHKARYECCSVSKEKRQQSQVWLATRGLTRLDGSPVKIGDPLPKGGS